MILLALFRRTNGRLWLLYRTTRVTARVNRPLVHVELVTLGVIMNVCYYLKHRLKLFALVDWTWTRKSSITRVRCSQRRNEMFPRVAPLRITRMIIMVRLLLLCFMKIRVKILSRPLRGVTRKLGRCRLLMCRPVSLRSLLPLRIRR